MAEDNILLQDKQLSVANCAVTSVIRQNIPWVLTINGYDGPIARIEANGHVTMLKEDVNEAARVFWQAIHLTRPRCPNCNSDLQLV